MRKILNEHKWILIFVILCVSNILINHFVQVNLFTDDVYRDSFGYLASEDRIEKFLQSRTDGQLQNALFSVLQLVLKLIMLTIAVLIGFALYRAKVRLTDVFKSILIAEFVMFVPSIIRIFWFMNYEELIVIGDYKAFAPWSAHYYLSKYNVPISILNISVLVNVFEFLFLTVVIYRLKTLTNFSYLKTLKYTLIGYVPFLAISIILFSSLLRII